MDLFLQCRRACYSLIDLLNLQIDLSLGDFVTLLSTSKRRLSLTSASVHLPRTSCNSSRTRLTLEAAGGFRDRVWSIEGWREGKERGRKRGRERKGRREGMREVGKEGGREEETQWRGDDRRDVIAQRPSRDVDRIRVQERKREMVIINVAFPIWNFSAT